jgi:hypothetical protein
MSDYPDGFEGFAGKPTSDATRRAYAELMRVAAKRPKVTEATMDRKRVRWQLCQLVDAGVVKDATHRGGVGTIIDARGFIGQRNYRTTRELEAFVHGAMAGLDT